MKKMLKVLICLFYVPSNIFNLERSRSILIYAWHLLEYSLSNQHLPWLANSVFMVPSKKNPVTFTSKSRALGEGADVFDTANVHVRAGIEPSISCYETTARIVEPPRALDLVGDFLICWWFIPIYGHILQTSVTGHAHVLYAIL